MRCDRCILLTSVVVERGRLGPRHAKRHQFGVWPGQVSVITGLNRGLLRLHEVWVIVKDLIAALMRCEIGLGRDWAHLTTTMLFRVVACHLLRA